MRTLGKVSLGLLLMVLALSTSAFAQERHAVDPSALAHSVTEHAAQQDADRAAIHEALGRPEVRQMAERAGIDLDKFDQTVDTLSGPSLDRVASAARDVNQAFIGGASRVVISTTTIIVALLVVILIIIAVS